MTPLSPSPPGSYAGGGAAPGAVGAGGGVRPLAEGARHVRRAEAGTPFSAGVQDEHRPRGPAAVQSLLLQGQSRGSVPGRSPGSGWDEGGIGVGYGGWWRTRGDPDDRAWAVRYRVWRIQC